MVSSRRWSPLFRVHRLQAPTIISVLNAKLRRCAYMLNNAQTMLSQCIDFEMGQGQVRGIAREPRPSIEMLTVLLPVPVPLCTSLTRSGDQKRTGGRGRRRQPPTTTSSPRADTSASTRHRRRR